MVSQRIGLLGLLSALTIRTENMSIGDDERLTYQPVTRLSVALHIIPVEPDSEQQRRKYLPRQLADSVLYDDRRRHLILDVCCEIFT